MATNEQVSQILATFGLSVPDFVIDAALDKVASVSACITGNYAGYDQLLIECYAAALIAGATGGKQTTSQHAPSGASQGYKVSDRGMNDLRKALLALDTSGCTASIIPPDTGAIVGVFESVEGI